MPIKPHPTTYKCPACGWSKTVAPRSDALGPGDLFSACPECGNEKLVAHPATLIERLLSGASRRSTARSWPR
ncbi:MAG: hypothetical protein LBR88_00460 [Zoogloeaceae bacterium]|nr:hypothetical protein [Zoogloeaceae bacterium]